MKKLIWTVILLVAIGAGGAVFYANRGDKEPQVTTLKVSRGDVIDSVGATGTLQAVTTVTVGTQVSGIVQDMYADFNSIVKKGQVIARLDPALLETALETAKANLSNAQANLERQKVTVQDAKTKLARAKELSAKQLLPQADFDTADVTEKQAEAQLKSMESQIVQAQAAVNKAKVDLDHTVITAPIDGIVIKRSVDRGQTVAASMQAPELFIIAADLTKMQVNANIDESDVGRMRPGEAVTFRVDAYPTETFRGTVNQVRLNPTTVQNVVTYSTVIDVPNPEYKLKPGMTANVTIEIARRTNVLRVPNAALRFRPTKDVFEALKQPTPPELERGFGRGRRSDSTNGMNGPAGPAANQPGAAPQPPGTATAGQVQAKAQQQAPSTSSGQRPSTTSGQRPSTAASTSPGQRPSMDSGQGQSRGGGDFANMTPEERQKRMQERLANMTPEQRAAWEERRKQFAAQGGFAGRGGPGGQQIAGRPGAANEQGQARRGTGGAAPRQQDARTGQKLAASTAQTIDSLFGPLPTVETRGLAWLYINKQLKPVRLRLGISDGTFTEVLNDTELQDNMDVVTSVITPEMSSRSTTTQTPAANNPLMPQRRGGPGGRGGGR